MNIQNGQYRAKLTERFEGVTTIPKGSTGQVSGKRLTLEIGDEIVCSIWEHIANTRLMYGGGAYSYANDPNFTDVSRSEKFWQKVIDAFYEKYYGFAQWHKQIVNDAMRDGQLVMPTGRIYPFEAKRGWNGELKAPETLIKNYPVQGLGADMMSIARVSFARRFKDAKIDGLLVNSVHDSIVCDIHKKDLEVVVKMFHSVIGDLPANFQKLFGVEFNLPMRCEVSYGSNMKELVEFT